MTNVFLFETKKIDKSKFYEFTIREIFYAYFLANHKYYLFIFQKESIDLNFIFQLVEVVDKLDSRKRQIRSMRGFILYALEIMETDKDSQILETNLKPFFWQDVKRIINQNKKNGLQNYLFPIKEVNLDIDKYNKVNIEHLKSFQSNIPPVATKHSYFENLKNISDEEKKEIIQKGFQLQAKKSLSLKEYYEGDNEESLINFKSYRIKYESIRRTKLYKDLKLALEAR